MHAVIIDNDVAFLRSLEIVLSAKGFSVTLFDNPDAGCSFIEEGELPDVLIVDYAMPGLTGEEVLERVRRYLGACQVILVSGHTDLVEPLDLNAMGVTAFLPKPLDLDKLWNLILPPCAEMQV